MDGRQGKQRTHRGGWKAFLTGLVVAAGVAWHAGPADATIRVGNSEIQVVYEMQHTFQFHNDPTDNFEWVQWRNELRVEYEYQDLVEVDRGLFGKNIKIPGVRRADFSFMYRGRFDPVFLVRDKYDDMYPDWIKNQHKSFVFPENGFREMNLDVDFGDIMGHRLSMKLGKQQIVWGESDLFRSIDIVNPLRIDQSGFIGEAFEDFRTPIWAVKFLYDLGNIGSLISNAGLEVFYTPRWRPITQHLVLEGGWGGLRYDDPNFIGDVDDYYPSTTSPAVITTKGVPWAPYRDWTRIRHPWSIFRVGRNAARMSPDSGCVADVPCTDDAQGKNVNFLYRIGGGRHTHMIRGTKWDNSMVGARFMGKAFNNFDFTLNYLFKRTDPAAVFDIPSMFGPPYDSTGAFGIDKYGRRLAGLNPNLDLPTVANGNGGIFLGDAAKFAAGDPEHLNQFRRSLDRCFKDNKATWFVNADLYGYSSREDGNPNNDRHSTACFEVGHWMPWTNVFGFTLTYNDFDYTGAVFRVEQSWSTNEPRNWGGSNYGGRSQAHFDAKLNDARENYLARIENPSNDAERGYQAAVDEYAAENGVSRREAIWGAENVDALITGPHTDGDGNPCAPTVNVCPGEKIYRTRIKQGTSVWRSMIGFDLIQSLGSLPGMAWTKRLPGGIGDQATFYTFQALTTYQNNNRPSGINAGTNAPQDRHQRWEQLYTFGTSGFYFRGKLEPLFAVGYSVNAKQPVILAQTYWHDWLIRNLDLFVGAAIYPGSINDTDASFLNYYADRDTVWFRLQYYLL